MDNPDTTINRIASRSHGIVTRSCLQELGLSEREIDWRVETSRLTVIHAGVYRHGAAPTSWEGLLLAAVCAGGPLAASSHRSAARLENLRGSWSSRPEITTRTRSLPLLADVRVHRTTQLDAADVTTVRGIRTTTIPRTLLDLGAVLPFEVVEEATQDAIIRGLTSAPSLVALLERVGRRGRNGTAALRAVVHQALPDERLQSELERRLLLLIQRSPMGAPALQQPVTVTDHTYFLDFAWPARQIAVEADGRRWHSTKRDFEAALVRERALRLAGWDVHHFGWSDVVERPASVIAHLGALRESAA